MELPSPFVPVGEVRWGNLLHPLGTAKKNVPLATSGGPPRVSRENAPLPPPQTLTPTPMLHTGDPPMISKTLLPKQLKSFRSWLPLVGEAGRGGGAGEGDGEKQSLPP